MQKSTKAMRHEGEKIINLWKMHLNGKTNRKSKHKSTGEEHHFSRPHIGLLLCENEKGKSL